MQDASNGRRNSQQKYQFCLFVCLCLLSIGSRGRGIDAGLVKSLIEWCHQGFGAFYLSALYFLCFGFYFQNCHLMTTRWPQVQVSHPNDRKENTSSLCSFLRSKENFPRSLPPQVFLFRISHWLELNDMPILKPAFGRGNRITMVGLYQPSFSLLGWRGVQLLWGTWCPKLKSGAWNDPVDSQP